MAFDLLVRLFSRLRRPPPPARRVGDREPARAGAIALALAALLLVAAIALAALARRSRGGEARAGFGFRGDTTGHFPAARPPASFSPRDHVRWSTAMPAWGNASPALARDRLYVTAEPNTLLAVALDDGRLLWRRSVAIADALPPDEAAEAGRAATRSAQLRERIEAGEREVGALRRDARRAGAAPDLPSRIAALARGLDEARAERRALGRYEAPEPPPTVGTASSTPFTDGEDAYVVFGNFVVARVTREGRLRWARFLPVEDRSMYGNDVGQAASPLLVDGVLVVPLGFLYGLDPDDGTIRWTGPRFRDFGGPAPISVGDRDYVVTADGEVVRARDGAPAARGIGMVQYVGPLVPAKGEPVVYFVGSTGPGATGGAAGARAVRLERGLLGGIRAVTLWDRPLHAERYFASPIRLDGKIFATDQRGALEVLDAATGRTIATRPPPPGWGITWSSFSVADGRLFTGSDQGGCVVELDATRPPFSPLRSSCVDETILSTPVFRGDRVYLRGYDHLWCFEGGG